MIFVPSCSRNALYSILRTNSALDVEEEKKSISNNFYLHISGNGTSKEIAI